MDCGYDGDNIGRQKAHHDLEKKMTVDQEIGERVREARGTLPQRVLADQMKTRGHRWSQSTVWNIEEGERRFMLSEAVDVADLLGTTLDFLTGQDLDAKAAESAAEAMRLRKAARTALEALRAAL